MLARDASKPESRSNLILSTLRLHPARTSRRILPSVPLADAARSFLELRFIYTILNDLEVEITSREGTLRDYFLAKVSLW